MLALSPAPPPAPRRAYGEPPRERVERALLREHRPVPRLPPVALQEARHHAVTAPPVPDEHAPGAQYARELRDDPGVVRRIEKEAERGEEVDDRVEAPRPPRRQPPHVAAAVAQRTARASGAGARKQVSRVVERVDVEPSFREKVGVPPLPARHVQHA